MEPEPGEDRSYGSNPALNWVQEGELGRGLGRKKGPPSQTEKGWDSSENPNRLLNETQPMQQ